MYVECPSPQALYNLFKFVDSKKITTNDAQTVLREMLDTHKTVDDIIIQKGLIRDNNVDFIGQFIDQAIAENPKSVADYKAGKEAAIKHIMGQVMKLSKGKASPNVAMDMLKEKLK